jgi:hypothetical protein
MVTKVIRSPPRIASWTFPTLKARLGNARIPGPMSMQIASLMPLFKVIVFSSSVRNSDEP